MVLLQSNTTDEHVTVTLFHAKFLSFAYFPIPLSLYNEFQISLAATTIM